MVYADVRLWSAEALRCQHCQVARRTPPGYPTELVSDLVFSDGRSVHIRPILPEDAPALAEAIARADDETLRARFLGSSPEVDETMLRHLVEVDYRRRLALVALDSTGRGVGIARYESTAEDDVAEVAVVVSRAWRRVGLGSGLFMLLAQAALVRGIDRFRALCLVDNEDVIGLLRASNLPYRTSVSKGVIETELELGVAPQPSA
jgi:RimJ/RimL family protein N-acetyltransferase